MFFISLFDFAILLHLRAFMTQRASAHRIISNPLFEPNYLLRFLSGITVQYTIHRSLFPPLGLLHFTEVIPDSLSGFQGFRLSAATNHCPRESPITDELSGSYALALLTKLPPYDHYSHVCGFTSLAVLRLAISNP
jgi:hypothetical protein